MTQRGEHGRVVCPVCDREVALKSDGTPRAHRASPGDHEHCPGWGVDTQQGEIMVKQDNVIDAEVIEEGGARELVVRPQVELAVIEPVPWVVDDLLCEAINGCDEDRTVKALELIEKLYPEFHRRSGEWRSFTIHDLGEDHRASLRAQFPETEVAESMLEAGAEGWKILDEEIETRFHDAEEHLKEDKFDEDMTTPEWQAANPPLLTPAQKQKLYYQGLP